MPQHQSQPHFLQQLSNKLNSATQTQQQTSTPTNPSNNGQQYPYPPLSGMFTGDNGKFDFNKASNAIDQVVKTANQVSPIVKQIGALFTPKT